MQLLTFAHYPEAQAFIEHFALKKHPKYSWLHHSDSLLVILTGEGLYEAGMRTSLCLGLFPAIDSVLNFGVAGTLDPKLPIHHIVKVRSIYGFDQKPLFKSFQSDGNCDLVSSATRILDPNDVTPLKTMGQIVDREAWAIAFAAKDAGKEFQAFKYISDIAGELNACEPVKELASEASQALLETYLEYSPNLNEESPLLIKGFHFTFSQQIEVKKLIHKLSIKFKNDVRDWLNDPIIKELQEQKITPKQRSKEFANYLRMKLDPFAYKKILFLNDFFHPLKQKHIEIGEGQSDQEPRIKVNFNFSNQLELKTKLDALKDFNFDAYYRFWQGENDD